MGTTSFKRKALKNRVKAKQRKADIKRLTSKPVIKNIDPEELIAKFGKTKVEEEKPTPEKVDKSIDTVKKEVVKEAKASKSPAKSKEEPKAEVKKEVKAPKAAKKPAPKKKETKAKE